MLTFFVGFAAMWAFVAAFLRTPPAPRPGSRGLLLRSASSARPLLGGFTVLYDLAPGFVMSHYLLLSMLILVACVALELGRPSRARRPPTALAIA